jgi:hypothetical protein
MAYKYVVTQPFHGYVKGQEITDPDEIAKVLADHDFRVVRVFVPDQPPPDQTPPTG